MCHLPEFSNPGPLEIHIQISCRSDLITSKLGPNKNCFGLYPYKTNIFVKVKFGEGNRPSARFEPERGKKEK